MTPTRTALVLALALGGLLRRDDDSPSPAAIEFFEAKVRPLLADHCFKCHGEKTAKSGLRLDSRDAVLLGGEKGPVVVAGKPDESRLVQAVRRVGELKMPPKETLDEQDVATLVEWVKLGLPWPQKKTDAATAAAGSPTGSFTEAQRSFWSFQPVTDPTPPIVRDASWPRNDLDRFVLASIETHGLKPAPAADRRTLIRRATFDLTGLPPTPDEVAAFLADDSPDAFAKVVDRLLASPRYGERWARHWLDVVRYTDSFDARSLNPGGAKGDVSEAWRYRDWVVDAFNRDLPFEQFVTDQLAGDLVAENAPDHFDRDKIIATGVLAIGNWGGGDSDKEKLLTDIVDDQVDLVGRGFLGLTISCARCHDHKFDPIPTTDYYGLAGIFMSSHILAEPGPKTEGPPMLKIPLLSRGELESRRQREARIAELQTMIEQIDAGDGRLLLHPVRDVLGNAGVHALKGAADTPTMTVNTNDREVAFLTVKLPPKCVTVHPSPTAGVAVSWTSPMRGAVEVSGRVADADAVCGDGIDFNVERLHSQQDDFAVDPLVAGAFVNGAAASLDPKLAFNSKLARVEVEPGDRIRVVVKPKAEYTCDTTVVELVVRELAGESRTWNLTEEVVAAAARNELANPQADRFGHADVWSFRDLAPPPAAASATNATPSKIEPARTELAQLQAHAPPPIEYADGVQEGGVPNSAQIGVHDVQVHIRGRYDRLGDLVPRHFPRIVAGDAQSPLPKDQSGRLELARWLANPKNPLTARVLVNRIWQHHFGAGIVHTPGNFGKQGEPPTHPELLDWLARRFVEAGGSIKTLQRLIMTSSVYQQSSVPAAAALDADPENRLLARMTRQRLDAEELRDAMLAVTNELDETRGGPATRDPAARRRTLYVMTIRSDRGGDRELFDAADPTAIVDVRTSATVAPQALYLMNSSFVLARAEALAKRILSSDTGENAARDAERIARLYEWLFAREPSREEIDLGLSALARGASGKDDGREEDVARQQRRLERWSEHCQILLMSNEWMYVD